MNLAARQFANTNDNFENVTFEIVEDGYVTITPLTVTVKIAGKHDSQPYNGEDQTVTGYEVTEISNPLYTEEDFTFNGTASATRKEVGTTYMKLDEEQFVNNNDNFEVAFEVTDGYMEVTPLEDVVVTIKGHQSTETYDGEEHTATGYDVEISNTLYTEEDFTFSGTAEAKRTDVETTYMELDISQFANANVNFENVRFEIDEDGFMEIVPANITIQITGHNATYTYNSNTVRTVEVIDGMEIVTEGYGVSGYEIALQDSNKQQRPLNELFDPNKVKYDGDPSIRRKDPGKYNMGLDPNKFSYDDPNLNATFDVIDGTLTILPPNDPTPDDPTPGPGPGGDPTPDPLPPAIIPENPVPLAPAPDADLAPGVLGARRTLGNGSVLGARRGMDQAVLGKRRNPNTGDNSLFMWLVALMSSLAGAGATLFGINKTKKKDED